MNELTDKCPEYSEKVLLDGLTTEEIAIIYATVMSASTIDMTRGWGHMVELGTQQEYRLNKFAKRW